MWKCNHFVLHRFIAPLMKSPNCLLYLKVILFYVHLETYSTILLGYTICWCFKHCFLFIYRLHWLLDVNNLDLQHTVVCYPLMGCAFTVISECSSRVRDVTVLFDGKDGMNKNELYINCFYGFFVVVLLLNILIAVLSERSWHLLVFISSYYYFPLSNMNESCTFLKIFLHLHKWEE